MDPDITHEKKNKRKNREEEEDYPEIPLPRKTHYGKKIKMNYSKSNYYDDKTFVPNIMLMEQKDRLAFLREHPNPFGYPEKYWDIYSRERQRRNLTGFENLMKINGVKLFTDETDQIPGKMIIKNHRNINTIKSRENYDLKVIENIEFQGEDTFNYFKAHNMNYVKDKDEFISNCMHSDENYKRDYKDIMNTYYIERHGKPLNEIAYLMRDFITESEISHQITDEYKKNVWEPEYERILANKNCDIYDCVIAVLRMVLGDLQQYVVIAGGFALSMYIYKNYGYHVGFNDIDLFIHSCSPEVKDEIIIRIKEAFDDFALYNENVILFPFSSYNGDSYNIPIFTNTIKSGIQIIRRLYSCPQEIITGFDIDCCCILTTLEGNLWITERGAYSLVNGYNTFNFERMSPSYEYRLLKYCNRGFAIWIPFMEYFRDNAIFDFTKIDKTSKSYILLKYLANILSIEVVVKKASEDYDFGHLVIHKKEILDFKTLNPNEQTINTFHRIFLEDPLLWYPKKPEGTLNLFNINHCGNQTIEIKEYIQRQHVSARNIITNFKDKCYSSKFASDTCLKLLQFLHQVDNNIIVYDDIPKAVIFGIPGYNLTLEKDENINEHKIEFMFRMYHPLLKFSSLVLKLKEIELNYNPFDFMRACQYFLCNDQGERHLIDLSDESRYEEYNKLDVERVFSQESYQKYLENPINKASIEIVLPSELSNLFLEIMYIIEYKKYCEDVLVNLYRESFKIFFDNYYYCFRKEDEEKEQARINVAFYKGNYQLRTPVYSKSEGKEIRKNIKNEIAKDTTIMSFEEFSTQPLIKNHLWFYPDEKVSFISHNKNKKQKLNKFYFKDGKLYGTEYDIVKIKFKLDYSTILEYPAIDNFVPF